MLTIDLQFSSGCLHLYDKEGRIIPSYIATRKQLAEEAPFNREHAIKRGYYGDLMAIEIIPTDGQYRDMEQWRNIQNTNATFYVTLDTASVKTGEVRLGTDFIKAATFAFGSYAARSLAPVEITSYYPVINMDYLIENIIVEDEKEIEEERDRHRLTFELSAYDTHQLLYTLDSYGVEILDYSSDTLLDFPPPPVSRWDLLDLRGY